MAEEESLPRLLAKRYRLESRLGSGGMGVVYRATDVVMQRPVAVKLIRGEEGVGLDEEVAGRFVREAKHTARIQHENIIEVFDLGRSERGDLFFAMELVEGESLSSRLRRVGRVSAESTVHIGRQICLALGVAHAHGIIHRDLKPANIMLVERAGDPDFVKVLDFGVAKATGPEQQTALTQTGMLVGTVEYMSPEQIMAKGVDARSDVYSLGVVLYRMLTGKPPFRDAGVPAIIHSHLNLVPPSVVQIAPEVPLALDRVVMRCLAKDPAHRYDTMMELAEALDASLAPAAMMDLEYHADDDPYGDGDRTELTHSPPTSDPVPRTRSDAPLDEATIKLDRSYADQVPTAKNVISAPRPAAGARPAPPAPPPPPPHSPPLGPKPHMPITTAPPPADDATLVLQEDLATAKRSIPEEALRSVPKTCAMCQTVNPAHARACTACGISLAADEQAAVRARVAAPVAAPSSPSGVALGPASPMGGGPAAPAMSGAYPTSQAHGAPPGMPPHGPAGPPPPPPPWANAPPPRPSMWQRFLAWTGLGGR